MSFKYKVVRAWGVVAAFRLLIFLRIYQKHQPFAIVVLRKGSVIIKNAVVTQLQLGTGRVLARAQAPVAFQR